MCKKSPNSEHSIDALNASGLPNAYRTGGCNHYASVAALFVALSLESPRFLLRYFRCATVSKVARKRQQRIIECDAILSCLASLAYELPCTLSH